MNHTLFFSSHCPDTKAFVDTLSQLNIPYDSVDITASMKNLKQFLEHRDFKSVFDSKKENNQVGVPVLVVNSDKRTDYIFELMDLQKINNFGG